MIGPVDQLMQAGDSDVELRFHDIAVGSCPARGEFERIADAMLPLLLVTLNLD